MKTSLLENKLLNIVFNDMKWKSLKEQIMLKENIKPETRQGKVFSTVLENERKYIQFLKESQSISFDQQKVQRIVLPLVRRFWPKLVQTEVVSTQPLEGPVGFVRKLVIHYQGSELPGIVPESQVDVHIPQTPVTQQQDGIIQTFVLNLPSVPVQLGTVSVKFNDGTDTVEVQKDDGLGRIKGSYNGQDVTGTVDYKQGLVVVYFVSVPPQGTVEVHYQKQWEQQTDQDYQNREVSFEIVQDSITQVERKLRQKWMPEFTEDVQQIDNLDYQVEMYDSVQNIIAQEINQHIFNELYSGYDSENKVTWDKDQPTSSFYGTRKEWYETLMISVNELQQKMQSKTNITEPDIIVGHPSQISLLRSQLQSYGMEEIKPLQDDTVNVGYRKYEINGGQYKVYSTNLVPPERMLLVYKGQRVEDNGYIFAPYIPLTQVPWTEPTGMIGINFHTRYGTLLYRPEWFGEIEILNLV